MNKILITLIALLSVSVFATDLKSTQDLEGRFYTYDQNIINDILNGKYSANIRNPDCFEALISKNPLLTENGGKIIYLDV